VKSASSCTLTSSTVSSLACLPRIQHTSADEYSIRQHTSHVLDGFEFSLPAASAAYVSRRLQHTSAYVSIPRLAYVSLHFACLLVGAAAYASILQHTSVSSPAYLVQHTSVYVSIRQHTSAYVWFACRERPLRAPRRFRHTSADAHSIRQHSSVCLV
jgi:hypothetical protein